MDSTKLGASFGSCPEHNENRHDHNTVGGPESNFIRSLSIGSYNTIYNCAVSHCTELPARDVSLSSRANVYVGNLGNRVSGCHHSS